MPRFCRGGQNAALYAPTAVIRRSVPNRGDDYLDSYALYRGTHAFIIGSGVFLNKDRRSMI